MNWNGLELPDKLEDLTKEELLEIIRGCFYQPSHRDILDVRWKGMARERSRIMDGAIKESQKWQGKRDFESLQKWNDAQEKFNNGLALSDKADIVFEKLCETKD